MSVLVPESYVRQPFKKWPKASARSGAVNEATTNISRAELSSNSTSNPSRERTERTSSGLSHSNFALPV